MVVNSLDAHQVSNLVVDVQGSDGVYAYGTDSRSGESVAFAHEGLSYEGRMTMYAVTPTDSWIQTSREIKIGEYLPLRSTPVSLDDLSFFHDVCCGLGGFSSALEFLQCSVITAVDVNELAKRAYELNHSSQFICGDISSISVVYQMHQAQLRFGRQPMLAAGFPCQPLSRQGAQRRQHDARSKTLGGILEAGHLLGSAGLFLECVPEAMTDESTQRQLHEYAQEHRCQVFQQVLHLHSVWPSRRSRWFAVVLPLGFGEFSFPKLPELSPPPSVGDLMPSTLWPVWPQEQEQQLLWTDLEHQVYGDVQYGSTDRAVKHDAPLPTALHSWANAVYPCPCQCRKAGLSPHTLRAGGLRGIAVISGYWPYPKRHIHPKELQLFLGFSPLEKTLENCRAQICLFGNSVSPVQVIWTWAHILHQAGLLPADLSASEVLARYVEQIVHHRDVTWPSPTCGSGVLCLKEGDQILEISFHTSQKVQDLLQAEMELRGDSVPLSLVCEGIQLPLDAHLQAREYEVVSHDGTQVVQWFWIGVAFLGEVRPCWVPPTLTMTQLLRWCGLPLVVTLADIDGRQIMLDSHVQEGQIVVVQQSPDEHSLDLALLEGFGFDSQQPPAGLLRLTEPVIATGMWAIDQAFRSQLLVTWVGSGFAPLSVWLPSFVTSVLEQWPSLADASLAVWLVPLQVNLYAFVLESWGWTLVFFHLDTTCVEALIWEPAGLHAANSHRLVHRVHQVSTRPHLTVQIHKVFVSQWQAGTFAEVVDLLHAQLGVPKQLRVELDSSPSLDEGTPELTQTLSMPQSPPSEPETANSEASVRHGLTAKMLLQVAHAIIGTNPVSLHPAQVQVVCLDVHGLPECITRDWKIGQAPLHLFVLVRKHWVYVACTFQNEQAVFNVWDGLGLVTLSDLAHLCASVKKAWGARSVLLNSQWIIEQTRADSCGTVALGHFALTIGQITYEQAMHFESLHPCFATCSSLLSQGSPEGFGNEAHVQHDLAELLPTKGVPEDKVKERIQAAFKTFGHEAIGKALRARNQWAALKQLGNSRPKPFMWVLQDELQTHIRERATSDYGVGLDIKRTKQQRQSKKMQVSTPVIDPSSLTMPPEVFVTSTGDVVSQIPLDAVCKNAAGVAFARPPDVQQFLNDGKFISPEALAVLVIGTLPSNAPKSLPMNQVQVPAIYKGTNEPILIDCVSIQLGDQAIYQKKNRQAPEISVFPTTVFRVHVFRDLWEFEYEWAHLISRPIKTLVEAFDILQLCKEPGCQDCGKCHPSLEEDGIESGLLDIWAFHWHTTDGSRVAPAKATVLSVYFRVPESSFQTLHNASGQNGVFFEPRHPDRPGPDDRYAIVWLSPSHTLADALHKVKTIDEGIAVCRLGNKYGVRCLAKDQEDLHNALSPGKPFIQCAINHIFRLEPLPAGSQRQSLADMIHAMGWKAKPLQPCKGSQGKAWTVGSETMPPHPFFQAQHGWVGITKVKDQFVQAPPKELIATVKTRQHMQEATSSTSATASTDPWLQPNQDPWAPYNAQKTGGPPSQHVQQKFDDVQQKLTDKVQASFDAQMKQFATSDAQARDRISSVENQVRSLLENQQKLHDWTTENSGKVAELKHEQQQMSTVIAQCQQTMQCQGQALEQVVQEVAVCSNTLNSQGHTLQQVSNDLHGLQRGLTSQLDDYFSNIPWQHVSQSAWEVSDIGPILPRSRRPVGGHDLPSDSVSDLRSDSETTTQAFRTWSRAFEKEVAACSTAGTPGADRSYFGRGQLVAPRLRHRHQRVPKHSREGEVTQTCGFLNRATAHWFKQLRRLQSYLHAANSARVDDNFHSRAALWHSILRAPGFVRGFQAWWPARPHVHQGSPEHLPQYPPNAPLAQLIFDDFQRNYRCFEHYQWRRRQDSCQAKLLSATRNLFAATRKPARYALDCLEDTCSQTITVVDPCRSTIAVDRPFPDTNVVAWTLQNQPAQVTYCRQLRNKVLTDRVQSVLPTFAKLRTMNLPMGVKQMNIKQCLWPRALHGCEAVQLADRHLERLRTGVMQALHWNHAGASPVARVSLFHLKLDPEWYQLQHVMKMFRHQCRSNKVIRDWWTLFCRDIAGRDTHGPFGKILLLLQGLGLQIDKEFRLWFTERGYVNILTCTDTVLDMILTRFFQLCKARQLADRQGYDGLQQGCDVDLTISSDLKYDLTEQAHLMTARDGTFISDFEKAKFDTRVSPTCVHCRTANTRQHKYTVCSQYDSARARALDLFEEWDSYPTCFQTHGIVPLNPWLPTVWEALILLPSRLQDFRFEAAGSTLHVFTDGSVANPQCAEDSLASWAVVVADRGPLSWGPLPGLQQTIPRAEAYALLSVAHWIADFHGTVHIWSDSQDVVTNARLILRHVFDPQAVEHEDIWQSITDLLQSTEAEISFHKVPSHDQEQWCASPLEDFARVWNTCVDAQATIANQSRPAFFNLVWEKHQEYRRNWKERVRKMTAFQVDVAKIDCQRTPEVTDDVEEDLVPFDFDWSPNMAQVSVQLQPWVDNENLFTHMHDSHFRRICAQFLHWISEVDISASRMRSVSLIEIYVAYRLVGRGGAQVSDDVAGLFSVVSVDELTSRLQFLLTILMTGYLKERKRLAESEQATVAT
eukprot:Skav218155  [mRNA]  locus=scaffold4591:37336:49156:+ [translate_table: standard]